MIKYFKSCNSRWCCIFKNFPQAYMLEHEIGMMHTASDSSDDEKAITNSSQSKTTGPRATGIKPAPTQG
jgi:hypothetical protein